MSKPTRKAENWSVDSGICIVLYLSALHDAWRIRSISLGAKTDCNRHKISLIKRFTVLFIIYPNLHDEIPWCAHHSREFSRQQREGVPFLVTSTCSIPYAFLVCHLAPWNRLVSWRPVNRCPWDLNDKVVPMKLKSFALDSCVLDCNHCTGHFQPSDILRFTIRRESLTATSCGMMCCRIVIQPKLSRPCLVGAR